MSASTERLVEQIKLTEAAITAAESGGQDTSVLRTELKHLQRKLQAASEALTESKQVLKG